MKIALLTPGTGNFHCGSCLRDHTLVRALRRLGHDAHLVPMYLPQVADGDTGALEHAPLTQPDGGLFFGGVNVYLQQKLALFRHTPRWLDRLLDTTPLLRGAAAMAGMTSPRDLGQITHSMLLGEHGRQTKELHRLTNWLKATDHPEVVCLNNALLLGLARPIREALGVPVCCTLQGEDSFLDTLAEPYRERAWQAVAERSRDVDVFLAVSAWHAQRMADRGGIDRERIRVVHNGIPIDDLSPHNPGKLTTPSMVGYVARMSKTKGLDTLVQAFIQLKQKPDMERARLCVVGAETPADRAFVRVMKDQLDRAGLAGFAAFHPNVIREHKAALLGEMSVLSVPATYGESFGLYVLEAWACGVPVVQPRSAGFVELLESTGGGVLCEPDSREPWFVSAAQASKTGSTTGRKRCTRCSWTPRLPVRWADAAGKRCSIGSPMSTWPVAWRRCSRRRRARPRTARIMPTICR